MLGCQFTLRQEKSERTSELEVSEGCSKSVLGKGSYYH